MTSPARTIQLVDPPRAVPLKAQLVAVFGGVVAQMGWGFIAMGLLFTMIFGVDSEAMTLIEFRGSLGTTKGEVVGIHETSSSENKRRILRVHYRYQTDGQGREGDSYTLSRDLQPGEEVTVEYLTEDPSRSRIQGLRARTFGVGGAFTVLFPIVGLFVVLGSLRGGFRRRRLMRIGRIAYGKLLSKRATNTRVNKQTVYELTFQVAVPKVSEMFGYRQAADTEPDLVEVKHKTHLTAELEDDAEEAFFYDPRDPRQAYPVDGLPGKVTIGANGQIDASQASVLSLLLPSLALFMVLIVVLLLIP